jgi:hypothetical protein
MQFLLTLFCSSLSVSAKDTLYAGEILWPGNSLWSSSGQYELAMQTDGNLVWYDHWGAGFPANVQWASNTFSPNSYLGAQGDGNIVIYSQPDLKALWATGTRGPNVALTVHNERAVEAKSPSVSRWCIGNECQYLIDRCFNQCHLMCLSPLPSFPGSDCYSKCREGCNRCNNPFCSDARLSGNSTSNANVTITTSSSAMTNITTLSGNKVKPTNTV